MGYDCALFTCNYSPKFQWGTSKNSNVRREGNFLSLEQASSAKIQKIPWKAAIFILEVSYWNLLE